MPPDALSFGGGYAGGYVNVSRPSAASKHLQKVTRRQIRAKTRRWGCAIGLIVRTSDQGFVIERQFAIGIFML
jgi:hypothetical protein